MKGTGAATGPPQWRLNSRGLTAGDVILERGNDNGSRIVAAATGGHFSHAMMSVGGTDVIEAMPGGSRVLSVARVLVSDPDDWKLLRVPSNQANLAKQAAAYGRNLCFKRYDTEGAVRSPWMPRKTIVADALFCSQLIAEAYLRAGIEVLPGKSSTTITPNDLGRSKIFEVVSLPLVRVDEATARNWGDRSSAYEASPMAREKEISFRLFESVSLMVSANAIDWQGQAPPGNLAEIIERLANVETQAADLIADALLKGMKHEGYFNLLDESFAELLLMPPFDDPFVIAGWEDTKARHGANARACAEFYSQHKHSFWMSLRVMHVKYAAAFDALIEKARAA